MSDPLEAQKQESFSIPNLPKGKKLEILLLTNWGDQFFIGLNGV